MVAAIAPVRDFTFNLKKGWTLIIGWNGYRKNWPGEILIFNLAADWPWQKWYGLPAALVDCRAGQRYHFIVNQIIFYM